MRAAVWSMRALSRLSRGARDLASRIEEATEEVTDTLHRSSDRLASIATSRLHGKLSGAAQRVRHILFGSVAMFVLYVCAGAFCFQYFEGWTFANSVYFCMVTISTVGYGDMNPETVPAKIFTVAYIFLGAAYVFTNVSTLLGQLELMAISKVQLLFARTVAASSGVTSINGAATRALPSAVHFYLRNTFCIVAIFCASQCALAVPYMLVPHEVYDGNTTTSVFITYGDALYFSWITATTVGYGSSPDGISVAPEWFRPYVSLHILVSTSLLASLVSYLSTLKGTRTQMLKQKEIQDMKLTEQLIEEIDRDGDGVDKLEFVIGMLSKLDIAYWHDVQPLIQLFEQFDKDKSGKLNKHDVVLALRGEEEDSHVGTQLKDGFQGQYLAHSERLPGTSTGAPTSETRSGSPSLQTGQSAFAGTNSTANSGMGLRGVTSALMRDPVSRAAMSAMISTGADEGGQRVATSPPRVRAGSVEQVEIQLGSGGGAGQSGIRRKVYL